jgi:hypothetical protein
MSLIVTDHMTFHMRVKIIKSNTQIQLSEIKNYVILIPDKDTAKITNSKTGKKIF